MRASTRVGAFAIGLLALRATAELPGAGASPFVTVTSPTGFVPVTWSEPTNGIGFGGGGRRGGSGPVPFAGWVDFGLLGDQSVTVEWDFNDDAPSRWLEWSIARLDARDTPLVGVSWDGLAWQALGNALEAGSAAASWNVRLGTGPGPFEYRLSFRGVTSEPDSMPSPPVSFVVPAPGASALVATALAFSRRRREA